MNQSFSVSIGKATRGLLLVGLILALLGTTYALASGNEPAPTSPDGSAVATDYDASAARAGIADADRLSAAFQRVATIIKPSVVSIRSVRKVDPRRNPGMSPRFFDFFGRDFDGFSGPDGQQPLRQGAGTGFIVSENGHILTNNHVVADATEVEVELNDKMYSAEIVGTDPQTDLAVLKIDANGLDAVEFGDSEELVVGQWVVAVGDPFGLAESITAGIVSAKGRSRVGLTDYENFIQTDAAINPGNSGGPLVDLHGRVVGVNTAIASRSGGYQGIGFAIPADLAEQVTTSLIGEGRVVRGWLGVSIQDLTEDLASSFDWDSTTGALVGSVNDGSPADAAGLRSGDIIVGYQGNEVEDTNELRLLVAATRPGSRASLDVVRGGELTDVKVKIGELESRQIAAAESVAGAEIELGMSWRTLSDDLATQLGYELNPSGAVITEVEPFSAAAKAGLRTRDVVVAVGGEEVSSAREFGALLDNADLERGVRLTVLAGQSQRFVFLRG